MGLNRQQRRAQERKRNAPTPKGAEHLIRVYWTNDEAEIVEEALDAYQRDIRATLTGEPTPLEAWALDRAERMREALRAALEGRPWFDVAGNRERPTG